MWWSIEPKKRCGHHITSTPCPRGIIHVFPRSVTHAIVIFGPLFDAHRECLFPRLFLTRTLRIVLMRNYINILQKMLVWISQWSTQSNYIADCMSFDRLHILWICHSFNSLQRLHHAPRSVSKGIQWYPSRPIWVKVGRKRAWCFFPWSAALCLKSNVAK